MSVAEIKDEIRRMSAEERKEIARALLDCADDEQPRQAADFAEAKAYVFENYTELLRRLAQ
jgi:hypothetical protein